MMTDIQYVAMQARAEEQRRKRRIHKEAVLKATKRELVAEKSEILDYFDRLPRKELRAIYRAAKQQFGETTKT